MLKQAGLKIGTVEINRFHLFRGLYIIFLISLAWGLFTAVRMIDPGPTIAGRNQKIEEGIAGAQARLSEIQDKTKAIIEAAKKDAATIREQAIADSEVAAMEANAAALEMAASLGELISQAQADLRNIYRAQIQNAANDRDLRTIERNFAAAQKQFLIDPRESWLEKFKEIRTQLDKEKE